MQVTRCEGSQIVEELLGDVVYKSSVPFCPKGVLTIDNVSLTHPGSVDLVQEWLSATGWTKNELKHRPKRYAEKVELPGILRRQTPMSSRWIADRLHRDSASYVSMLNSITPRLSIVRTAHANG